MPSAVLQHRREIYWRSLAAVPILLCLAYQFQETKEIYGKRLGIVVPTEVSGETRVSVDELAPNGPAEAAGLRIGDVIVAVGDREVADPLEFLLLSNEFEAGETVEITIRRHGEMHQVQVTPGMMPDWAPLLINGFVALLYLVMALMTVDQRPGSVPSRLLYWLFVFLAFELALPTMEAASPWWLLYVAYALGYLVNGVQFGTELHLISLIPRRPDYLKRRPWMIPLFYGVGLVIGVTALLTVVVERIFAIDVFPWDHVHAATFVYRDWFLIWSALLVGMLASRIVSYPRSRGRLRAMIVLCGLLPWFLYVYFSRIVEWMGREIPLTLDEYLTAFALAPYPISIFVMLRMEDLARNRVLRNLIEEVQQAGSIEKISQLISEKLNLAFYTKCNFVFFRESRESELTTTHSSGSDMHVERIPSDYEILAIADRKGKTLAYPSDVTGPLPNLEKEWLDDLQANLIVPIVESEERMMGLLILGQKRSEEPYTPDDLELLHSLARQIAVAHENLALQLEVQDRERIQRQVLDRLDGEDASIVQECPACGFCFDKSEEKCPRDGRELTLTLPVERLIDGHYRLEQVLGRGGAAVVYLATDVRLNRGVAVKVLALSLLDDVVAPRRFEREARVSAQLLHPNIVTTHDFGKTRNGLPYIVMEFLEGRTMRQVLRSERVLSGKTAADWFAQILDGLGAAHALGVVHRDLKPDNVFIVRGQLEGEEETLKLLDFGLAKIVTQSRDENVTSPGTIMGTVSYMAPEQLSGGKADRRTDLYSVGVMAYESMIGKRPFEGRSPAQILTAILQGDVDFPALPAAQGLLRVLTRCFEQDRDRRYSSAAELRRELVPALAACPRLVRGDSEDPR